MRTLRFLLQKEFKQIFRDPSIIRIILIMPVDSITDSSVGSGL